MEIGKIDIVVQAVQGMQYERGYISPYFVTNSEEMSAELHNPVIFDCGKNSMQLESAEVFFCF